MQLTNSHSQAFLLAHAAPSASASSLEENKKTFGQLQTQSKETAIS